MVRRFDIVMVTDARLPGGTSASVAEEVRAQARAGYRTALLQIDSPLVRRPRPFAPRLRGCLERGELELLQGLEPVEAGLVMVRHPTVAGSIDPAAVPPVRAARSLLVVNQAPGMPGGPGEQDDPGPRYRPHEVQEHLEAWLGGPVTWVPIGPLVRSDLARVAPDLPQRDGDWVNVIDVAAWRQPRQGALHRIPVIGRHSRNDPLKWPATREAVLEVYPDRDDVEVHVLGGEPRLRELFGDRLPGNWLVHPFGTMPPVRFLAGVDFYVYYHHPALVEAFGRSIMEGMASGAPTILPPHFRILFEDAALYAEPGAAFDVVRGLHRDRAAYREAADRAVTFVEERFGHATHVRRLAELVEPTGAAPTSPAPPPSGVERADRPAAARGAAGEPRRVLFVSSNGAGVGHLMRLMSLAKHAPADVEPLFLTFSQAARVVDDAGYLVEYLASRSISGATAAAWHPMLRDRVNELIERYGVRAMVFDGTWPYQGLLDAATDHPGVGLVWSRRAMWKRGVSNPVLEVESDRFDLVLEPGELAADEDRGATRERRAEAVRVAPVTYLGQDELLEPAVAREELGLDAGRPAALVNLGAGNINDVSSLVGQVVGRLADHESLQVCVVRSIISDHLDGLPENVRTISVYPLARYLRAFDLAFAASGYNSYHELLLAAVPTAFAPNLDTATDDQAARSRFADRVGVGIDLGADPSAEVDRAVATLMDPAARRRMHERALARRQENGAGAAMQAVVDLVDRGVSGRPGPLSLRGESTYAVPVSEAERVDDPLPKRPPDTPPRATADPSVPAAEPGTDGGSPAVAAVPRGVEPGTPRSAASARQRLYTALRPLFARLQAPGLPRRIVGRAFYSLPAPVRLRLRRLARRFQPSRASIPPPASHLVPVPAGKILADGPELDLTPIAIVLPGTLDPTAAQELIDDVAQLQTASRSFAPLFFTSDIDFRPMRPYGYLFEYFPPRHRWGRLASADSWLTARQRRITSILRYFGVSTVITLPEPGDDGIDGLRATVAAVVGGIDD